MRNNHCSQVKGINPFRIFFERRYTKRIMFTVSQGRKLLVRVMIEHYPSDAAVGFFQSKLR